MLCSRARGCSKALTGAVMPDRREIEPFHVLMSESVGRRHTVPAEDSFQIDLFVRGRMEG